VITEVVFKVSQGLGVRLRVRGAATLTALAGRHESRLGLVLSLTAKARAAVERRRHRKMISRLIIVIILV
jgi:hypothetical protein